VQIMKTLQPVWIALLTVLALFAGAAAGYYSHVRHIREERIDLLMSDLASNILIMDAIEADKAEAIRPIVSTTVERDFDALLKMIKSGETPAADRLFCEVSRRVRAAKDAGKMFSDASAGFDVQRIADFLKSNCTGAPRSSNWAIEGQ
jgi:hypothetical protein